MIEDPKNRRPFIYYYIIVLVIMTALNFLVVPFIKEGQIKQVDYGTFMTMTEKGEISKVDIQTNQILFTGKNDNVIYKTGLMNDPGLTDRLHNAGVQFSSEIIRKESPLLNAIVSWVLPLVIFYFLWNRISKRMFDRNSANSLMFGGMGRSGAKIYVKSSEGIKFSDVAGEDEAKENLTEIVDYLHDPSKYKDIGASMPKGILLVGPPGTGKTMLAKAVAGEANVPFFSMSGSEFVEMFVGMGASKVRDLFKQAKEKAPCIVFIDEIDAIGKKRDGQIGGNDEREQTLNQLLTEMDGFEGNSGVMILAATNRPDILDPALLRPGRFDRQVVVGIPDIKAREEIFKIHSRNKPLEEDVNAEVLARRTPGFTPADIENMLNEAALLSIRKNSKAISMEDIEEAITKVIAGPQKKSRVISEKERWLTAVHESGHAVVARSLPETDPVHQITIVPRGRAGGFTMILPTEERFYTTKVDMEEQIVHLLGGRVAESLVLKDISTGASNDIQRATTIARDMVTKYGFSEKLGPVNYSSGEEVFIGRDFGTKNDFSEETSNEIDAEVKEIIHSSYEHATAILTEHMDKLLEVANALMKLETISGEEFEKLYTGEITADQLAKDNESKALTKADKDQTVEDENIDSDHSEPDEDTDGEDMESCEEDLENLENDREDNREDNELS